VNWLTLAFCFTFARVRFGGISGRALRLRARSSADFSGLVDAIPAYDASRAGEVTSVGDVVNDQYANIVTIVSEYAPKE